MTPRSSSSTTTNRVVFSCVVDSPPEIRFAAWIWAASLTAHGNQPPTALAAHFIEDCAPDLRQEFEKRGIRTTSVDRVSAEHPPSNKLAQLSSPLLGDSDYCVLCDCDLAFCGDISPWIGGDQVRAKLVDCAGFSLDAWEDIFRAAGLDYPVLQASRHSDGFPVALDGKPTIPTYCNGGLLILPKGALETLRELWPYWNQWLHDNPGVLGTGRYHADQVSFALACVDAGLDINLLPTELNVPTHLLAYRKQLKGIDPRVLHFHRRLDPHGKLQPLGVKSIDRRISQVNALIDHELHQAFDNALFWDYRYASHSVQGSGVGSRGKIAGQKQQLLASILADLEPQSVLDVGCGDLEPWRGLDPPRYTGIDISPKAIEIAQSKRPEFELIAGQVHELELAPYDLVVAFDVLIHQSNRHDYERLLTTLIDLAGRELLVAGYTRQPSFKSAITFYFESLEQSLTRLTPGGTVRRVSQYRDIDVFAWNRSA